MKIALSGYYGFDNAGDEALLSAITSSIKKIEPSAKFVVFSGHPQRTAALHNIRAVHYMNPLKLLRELRQADLLISGGGSIFQDVTSARTLPYYISVVALARLLGTPVIFYAQGVGPINRSISKFLMRLVANHVNLITLRDRDSALFLEEIGVTRPPLVITSDPVFSLEPEDADRAAMQKLLKQSVDNHQPGVGVSVRKWTALEGYQSELACLLDDLAERGYRVIFIPMAYPEDLTASRKVMELMRHEALLIDKHLSSKEHLALIAQLDLMIAMRLHALIFAASRGITFAGISYDPKVDAFLKLFALQPLPKSYTEMKNELNQLLNNQDLQAKIEQQASEMRRKSEDNARLALSLIRRKAIKR
ncbi:MAG: polysaccharide pyruvyl transferase CsaB [Syntrophomonas sp.]